LLGGFEARLDDGSSLGLPTHKYKALLAYLAVPAGRAHPRDELVALLWGSLPREQGRAALRQALWALRKALDRGGLRTLSLEDDAVALNSSSVYVDVTDFEQAIQGGLESLGRAVVLYRGSFLAGMAAREAPFEEWLMLQRDRLAELAVQGLGRLLAAQRTAGDHEAAVGTALRLLALDPVQEPVHRVLMQLYVSLGRHGAALRQYQSCVTVLERDLGIEPEPETRALYQDILRRRSAGGAPSVRPEPRPRVAAELPAATNSLFVGRQLERALLREALDQAVSGRGQVVVVEGEAGIGKTRLVTELAADAAGQGARIIFGRAYESDQVLPFGPWADALRRAQLASEPEIAELRPAWRAELGRLVPDLGDPTALLPGSVDSMQLFEGIVQLVAALARSGPVVIALDDLHWADDMSLRLLSFVARRISDALAVLLIVTARAEEMPDPLARAVDQLDLEFPLLQISLTPLGRDDTVHLARALAVRGDEPPAALADAIWAASEGNPFIAIETMRGFGENGIAETRAGLPLPERVRRLIDGRLDRLAPASRELVLTASVIGRDFEHGLLQAASGSTDGEVVAGLEELVRRRIFQAVGDHFDFSHDRIREVAYAGLLPPRRKLLHRRVAEAIERIHAGALEPTYGALGRHYYEAEAWDRARHFLERASVAARGRAAFREAGALLQQALATLEREQPSESSARREVDLRLHLHRVSYPLSDIALLSANLTRTRRLVATLSGNESRRAVMRVYESEYLRTVGDLRGAVEAGEEGLILARQLGDQTLEVEAQFHLGGALARQGKYRDAIAHLDAVGTAPSGQRHYPYAPARGTVVVILVQLGEFGEARWRAERDLRIPEHIEHPVGLGEGLIAIGRLELALGHATVASAHLARSLEIARKWEIAHLVPVSLTLLALANAAAGRISEANALIDEAERLEMWKHPRTPTIASLAPFLTGRVDIARRLAIEGLEGARTAGARGSEAEAQALRGLLALHDAECGGSAIDFGDAERWLREALAGAAALGMRPLEGHCHLGLGKLYRRIGKQQDAQEHLAAATAMYREMRTTHWLEQAETLLREA